MDGDRLTRHHTQSLHRPRGAARATRYAVYFTPRRDSAWLNFGCAWLGRDAAADCEDSDRGGTLLDPAYVRRITEEPRRYGFHATLKPPFRLRPEYQGSAVHRQFTLLAAEQTPFELPPLEAASLDAFVALRPVEPCHAVNALADRCVASFDNLRAVSTRPELERRRPAGLTAVQRDLLAQWGYPYVFGEFRFHFTLTGKLAEAERTRVVAALAPIVQTMNREPMVVDSLSLFEQSAPEKPFRWMRRYGFDGTVEVYG